MNVLNDVVDRFVISESTVTFSGKKKPLYFAENRERFSEFDDKIVHQIVQDTPDVDPFQRDSFRSARLNVHLKNVYRR